MLRTASDSGPLQGVMHSFSGTADEANQCLALGLHISFAGMVTFKKSDALRAVARAIPLDRLLIETDSPYLAPHPHRGQKPNEPALLIHTARCLAELRGIPLDEFAAQTTANARRLFGIS
jgi:TatD DNase family protein